MNQVKQALVVANWKMNPQTETEAKELFTVTKQGVRVGGGDVVIAAPALFLPMLRTLRAKGAIGLGAQNVSQDVLGAHTGEISALMLKGFGVSHVIVGHSELRASGETDIQVEKKVAQVLKAGMTAIMCVGERERDAHGKYFTHVEQQVRMGLRSVLVGKLAQLAIAYEPIWAISTATPNARAATPEDAHEMMLFIRKILVDLYGRSAAERVRILYGGSVDQKNIEALVARSGAQGYLVGGASLRPKDFTQIVRTVYG